jgi:hypothetical protein
VAGISAYPREYAAAAFQGAVQTLQAAAGEVQLIDGLRAGVGIVHRVADTPSELRRNFDRNQRQLSIATLFAGEDRGSEGRIYALQDLASEYARALAAPAQPEPEFVPEPEPESDVDVWKRVHQGTPRDRFTVSD